jgi:hypothetical protein
VAFGGSGLITRVTSFEGGNIILFTISVHLKSVLIKGVAFGESGHITVVTSFEGGEYNIIYYLCASYICPDKRSGLWWEWPCNSGDLF